MELILIGENKLKIMLSPEDMQKYEINCDSVDYANTETRRAFWNILDEAKHKTGFDAASDRVYIQLYPSRSGGCEMYVTKIGMICTPTVSHEVSSCPQKRKEQSAGKAYIFASLSDALMVSRQLEIRKFSGESCAYIDHTGRVILILTPNVENGSQIPEILYEYGNTADLEHISMYICEHCKCLCEHSAVRCLSALA